jgi:hypothetical protein
MKFSLARPVLALATMATLASCGGGGKATFPINVTVSNLLYPGLILSTNGQDLAVNPPATAGQDVVLTFPNQLEYGQTYEVTPKGATISNHTYSGGAQPKHQTCAPTGFLAYGTAGQLAKIDIRYTCSVNAYALTGVVKGLTGTGLTLSSGSNSGIVGANPALDANQAPTGADVALTMNPITYGQSYGVGIVTQPTGQTCTVTGGANGDGSGTMDDAAEANGGVNSLVVTCVKSS